jgi:acyl-CoA dehydrogenase
MYRQLHAACVTFAAVSDIVMGTMGGGLKRREGISARLGDVLSELYLMSCMLKRFERDGLPASDLPLVEWNYRVALCNIQSRLDEVLVELPNRPAAWLLRVIAFPWGRRRRPPRSKLVHACAKLLLTSSEARDRLTAGIYVSKDVSDATGLMETAFDAALTRDSIEAKLRESGISGRAALADLDALVSDGALTREDADKLIRANKTVRKAIAVNDFAPQELATAAKKPRTKKSASAPS